MLQYHIQVAETKASPAVAVKLYCHRVLQTRKSLFHLSVRITLVLANSTAIDVLNEHLIKLRLSYLFVLW